MHALRLLLKEKPEAFWLWLGLIMMLPGAWLAIILENPLWLAPFCLPITLWFAIEKTDWLLVSIAASIPFSINFRFEGLNVGLIFPSEPLTALLAAICLIRWITGEYTISPSLRKASWFLLAWLFLLMVLLPFSSYLSVSIKWLIVQSVYVSAYFIAWFLLIERYPHLIRKSLMAFVWSMGIVSLLISIKHSGYGFNKSVAMLMPPPFFSDHTLYGAALAMSFPIALYFWGERDPISLKRLQPFFPWSFLILSLGIGVAFCNSRAVWVSLFVGLALWWAWQKGLRSKHIALLFLMAMVVYLPFKTEVHLLLAQNKSNSKAAKAKLNDQLQSVTNIRTDVSNVERINRWQSAIRMIEEKPLTGFGPGTYQFTYIPFQKSREMTEISVTRPSNRYSQGMGGTAHSEYLLALSEQGLPAAILYFLFFLITIWRLLSRAPLHPYEPYLLVAWISFFFHGFFNNFMDNNKAAFLFYTLSALIWFTTDKGNQKNTLISNPKT
jgi:putative inorganic carbon (HCO3(-)) transporter